MVMNNMMVQKRLQDDGKKLYLSDEEDAVDNIYSGTLDELQSAVQAWKLVERAWDKFYEKKMSLSAAGAIRYDNPLGCKVQSSNAMTMDKEIVELLELEEDYNEAVRYYNSVYDHVKQLLLDSNLTDTEYRVMTAKYLCHDYPTFQTVARRTRMAQSAAFKVYKRAFVKVAAYVEKNAVIHKRCNIPWKVM